MTIVVLRFVREQLTFFYFFKLIVIKRQQRFNIYFSRTLRLADYIASYQLQLIH